MSSPSQIPSNCPFLRLPIELRDHIYAQLVGIKHSQTPKDAEACLRSTTFFNWKIDPTIFRVNHQISREARAVMARENDFVVIERAKGLEQGPEDEVKEDKRRMLYNVALWPGKATKKPNVPGERMRVKFQTAGASEGDLDTHVILAKELRDVCVGLSTFQDHNESHRARTYRTSGLSCIIKVHSPPYTETPVARDVRERALLEPLQKLRHFQHVSIEGTLPAINYQVTRQLTYQSFDRGLALTTIDELIASGDHSSSTSVHDIAIAYYRCAQDYLDHCAKREDNLLSRPAEISALEFRIMQHRSLNYLRAGDFIHAFSAAQVALDVAKRLFQLDSPPTAGPPSGPSGRITAAAFRRWTCERIKDDAARWGQRIKAEDIGRCYYYKSISERVLYYGEHVAEEQAYKDKYTGIGCCVISETMTENVPGELLRLDKQTREKLPPLLGVRRKKKQDPEEDDWVDEPDWEDDE